MPYQWTICTGHIQEKQDSSRYFAEHATTSGAVPHHHFDFSSQHDRLNTACNWPSALKHMCHGHAHILASSFMEPSMASLEGLRSLDGIVALRISSILSHQDGQIMPEYQL